VTSFAAIARREGDRAAYPPARAARIPLTQAAPAGLAVTALARALPHSWAEQERRLKLL
jgi:hypothetical protein